jgi:hypothetical protein
VAAAGCLNSVKYVFVILLFLWLFLFRCGLQSSMLTTVAKNMVFRPCGGLRRHKLSEICRLKSMPRKIETLIFLNNAIVWGGGVPIRLAGWYRTKVAFEIAKGVILKIAKTCKTIVGFTRQGLSLPFLFPFSFPSMFFEHMFTVRAVGAGATWTRPCRYMCCCPCSRTANKNESRHNSQQSAQPPARPPPPEYKQIRKQIIKKDPINNHPKLKHRTPQKGRSSWHPLRN